MRSMLHLSKNAVKAAFFVPLVLLGAGIAIFRMSRQNERERSRKRR